MNTIALALSFLLASPICYHAGIHPGGSHAVCTDEGTMTGRAVVLSLGLAGATLGLSSQLGRVETRPVEARVMGALYAPCKALNGDTGLIPDVTCGYQRRSSIKTPLEPPVTQIRGGGDPSDEEPLPVPLGDVLTAGKVDVLSRWIKRYEERTSTYPQDAGAWNDLAVGYLQRGSLANDPRDLVRAYGAADRASRVDENLLEARFNKALVLEYLFLPDAAQEAWEDYLRYDGTGGWADEARERLRKAKSHIGAVSIWKEQLVELQQAALKDQDAKVRNLVDRFRQAARESAEQDLFGEWGAAVLEGQDEVAGRRLKVLRKIGEALAATSGDRLVLDSVAAVDEAALKGDRERLTAIAQGARDFSKGFKLYQRRQSEQASEMLARASSALWAGRSALAWRADFFQVSNQYISRKYQETAQGAVRLGQRMAEANVTYPAIRGHLYWIKGMAEATLGKTGEGVADLHSSLRLFEEMREHENVANIYCRLGDVLMSRGRRKEGWANIYRALRTTPELRDPDKVSAVYTMASDAALQDQAAATALIFQKERVRQARKTTDNFLALIESLTGLARFQQRDGDDTGAQVSLREAQGLAGNLEGGEQRHRLADLSLAQGMIEEKDGPTRAIGYLTAALSTYQDEKNAIFSLMTYQTRGRAYRNLGRNDLAEEDFKSALGIYGTMGSRLEKAEDLRLAFLEETDAVFDEMVDLKADQQNGEGAFAYADRARTRVLPGIASKLWTGLEPETKLLLDSEPQPLPLDEIRLGLPEGVTLVQYSVLRDRTLIWTLRRSGRDEQFIQQEIGRTELENLVARSRPFETEDGKKAARELFDLLIHPWLGSLPKEDRLVFVPDKALHWVTFAALLDPSDKYLFQSYPITVTPSATIYVSLLERQVISRSADKSKGLIVGNPAFDHNEYPTLTYLSAANMEAKSLEIASRATLLEAEEATKAAFLAAAPQAEWIQFSGHALIDPANTLLSKLVFATSPVDNGALTAREIYSLDLSKTGLVVLAACDTGNEYVAGGEGVTSLARAFLAAGAPTVVASLWSVDDKATAQLFGFFHEEWKPGVDPVVALRKAQLKMLETEYKSPRYWAAFEVIGASAGGNN